MLKSPMNKSLVINIEECLNMSISILEHYLRKISNCDINELNDISIESIGFKIHDPIPLLQNIDFDEILSD